MSKTNENPGVIFIGEANHGCVPTQKCPVCGGNGIVPNGFYTQTTGQWATSDVTPDKCRTCQGTGIVEPKPEYTPVVCSTANLLDALKETHRHIEALYTHAGNGTTVMESMEAAKKRAKKLEDEIMRRAAL